MGSLPIRNLKLLGFRIVTEMLINFSMSFGFRGCPERKVFVLCKLCFASPVEWMPYSPCPIHFQQGMTLLSVAY